MTAFIEDLNEVEIKVRKNEKHNTILNLCNKLTNYNKRASSAENPH